MVSEYQSSSTCYKLGYIERILLPFHGCMKLQGLGMLLAGEDWGAGHPCSSCSVVVNSGDKHLQPPGTKLHGERGP